MDLSVGTVVEALEKKSMLRDSIIIFTTDNGGPAEGFNLNAASNWPLRGVKDTLFEGTWNRLSSINGTYIHRYFYKLPNNKADLFWAYVVYMLN